MEKGRKRIEGTKAIMLYLSNLEDYENLTDEAFGRVVKAVMRAKSTGEATELNDLETFVFKKLLSQVNRDETAYLDKLERDRERKLKKNVLSPEKVEMAQRTTEEIKVSQIKEKEPLNEIQDDDIIPKVWDEVNEVNIEEQKDSLVNDICTLFLDKDGRMLDNDTIRKKYNRYKGGLMAKGKIKESDLKNLTQTIFKYSER